MLPELVKFDTDWGNSLWELTPWTHRRRIWWKREDAFAPLGYGNLNGGKLRQCIWLVSLARAQGYNGIVTGASVKSPQLSMTTAVAKHYGMEAVQVIGSKLETARRRPQVRIAEELGAEFVTASVAYNPALQSRARKEAAARGFYYLEYGISVSGAHHDVAQFHALGANQVKGMPKLSDLVVPAGSCNSVVSVLLGIALHLEPHERPDRVHMVGIGPDKAGWIEERLHQCEVFYHRPVRGLFDRMYERGMKYNDSLPFGQVELYYPNLHTEGIVTYQDEVPWDIDDIHLHPTYEGKVGRWLAGEIAGGGFSGAQEAGRLGFWIVGSEVK